MDLFVQVKIDEGREPEIMDVKELVVLLLGALGVVAQLLHLKAHFGPRPTQIHTRLVQDLLTPGAYTQATITPQVTERLKDLRDLGLRQGLAHDRFIRLTDLNHGTQLFGE